MTRVKRKKPAQERLEKLRNVILRDASNTEKSAKELADVYGVSYPSLLAYYKKNNIKKKRKHHYNKKLKSGRSRIKDLRNYIEKNNITKEQIKLAVLSICDDARRKKARIIYEKTTSI